MANGDRTRGSSQIREDPGLQRKIARVQRDVGRRIREFREAKGLTMEAAAELARIHPSTLGRYERGDAESLSVPNLVAICVALGCDVGELFQHQ